jgi:plasmid stabilization system protein ParE
MPLRLNFRQDARAELRAAVRWYERQRAGLGDRFNAAVQAALDRIVADPNRFGKVYGEVRRTLITHFPYIVLFRVYDDRIRVISVFHTSRDPSVWQARSDEEPR